MALWPPCFIHKSKRKRGRGGRENAMQGFFLCFVGLLLAAFILQLFGITISTYVHSSELNEIYVWILSNHFPVPRLLVTASVGGFCSAFFGWIRV